MKRWIIGFVDLENGSRVRANGSARQDQERRGTGCLHRLPGWWRSGSADEAGALARAWETHCDGAMDGVGTGDQKDRRDEVFRLGIGIKGHAKAREGTDRHEKARIFESVHFFLQSGSLRTSSSARKWCLQHAPMRPINRSKPHETACARLKPLIQKFLFFCGYPNDGEGLRCAERGFAPCQNAAHQPALPGLACLFQACLFFRG